MFDTICTLPLTADLFAQAVHPSEPLLAVGLSSGHVSTLQLPAVDGEGAQQLPHGTDVVDTAWRTKRHKGSCRCLGYSVDGRQLYSAGPDRIVKAADSESGRVTGKFAIPLSTHGELDGPTVIHALSPQTLLLATDSGALHLYDLRDTAPPSQTHYPHTDYISSLSPLPPSSTSTSGYSKQWLTTGGTTLALTDLRRGVLVKSEDQEEILLSSLYVSGLPGKKHADGSRSSGEKALVGGGDGVITLWEKGQWDDQSERITVSREKETVDCISEVPEAVGGYGKKVAVGLGDGIIRFVKLGQNKVVAEVQHNEIDGVVSLSFDVGGRMISGGGSVLKVWTEHVAPDEAEAEEEADEGDVVAGAKRGADSDEDSGNGGEEEAESEEEESPRKRRKQRKKGKAVAKGNGFNFSALD